MKEMKNRRAVILIADDDPDDRLLLKDAFFECREGICIDFAADGEDLLDYLHKRTDDGLPDLILLDMRMPVKDGFETLEEMKADTHLRQIPVVAISGYLSDGDIERCYQLGASTVIIKPNSYDELSEVIKGIYNFWFKTSRG